MRGLIRDSYADFGPTLAAEKLRERLGIDLVKETVRRIMIDSGFWVPRRQRPPKVVSISMRVQFLTDATEFIGAFWWFLGSGDSPFYWKTLRG